jgi:protein gp37
LSAPVNTPVPKSNEPGARNVLVCSMADLFGDWVPREWIDQVIETYRKSPQWTYLFLTKNPKRLVDIEWPANAWVGTTVNVQACVNAAVNVMETVKASVKFISCEPLSENLQFPNFPFHWVIIGGRSRTSGAPAAQPKWEWVRNVMKQTREHGAKMYWKPNLQLPQGEVRLREYPVSS